MNEYSLNRARNCLYVFSTQTFLFDGEHHLFEEVFKEELFSERVDVSEVAAKPLTAVLTRVERHGRIDYRIPGTVDASLGEHRPTRLVYSISCQLVKQTAMPAVNSIKIH